MLCCAAQPGRGFAPEAGRRVHPPCRKAPFPCRGVTGGRQMKRVFSARAKTAFRRGRSGAGAASGGHRLPAADLHPAESSARPAAGSLTAGSGTKRLAALLKKADACALLLPRTAEAAGKATL